MNLDGIIEDYPNTTSLLNKDTFTNLANAILDKICPVGKTEIFYDNEDHSDYLGFTWERTSVGRAIVGIDESQSEFNTIGKTGGSKFSEAHSHNIFQKNPGGVRYPVVGQYCPGEGAYLATEAAGTKVASYNDAITWQLFTDEKGTGDSGNLPPYEVFAIWKRVA